MCNTTYIIARLCQKTSCSLHNIAVEVTYSVMGLSQWYQQTTIPVMTIITCSGSGNKTGHESCNEQNNGKNLNIVENQSHLQAFLCVHLNQFSLISVLYSALGIFESHGRHYLHLLQFYNVLIHSSKNQSNNYYEMGFVLRQVKKILL